MDSDNEKIVFEIRRDFRDLKKDKVEIKNKYLEFSENFPQLFDMICSDNCDDNILNRILSARRLVQSGSLSQHDASVQVGKDLVDKYVIPTVNKE